MEDKKESKSPSLLAFKTGVQQATQLFRYLVRRNKQKERQLSLSGAAKRLLSTKFPISSQIPKGKRYRVHRKMSRLFDQDRKVANYRLAGCIKSRLLDNRNIPKKFTKSDYYCAAKKKYDNSLRNYFRTLNRFLRISGYRVKKSSDCSLIVQIHN